MSTFPLRKWAGIAFVAVYLLLGVPLWYKLTTIYRAPLPRDYINSLHNNRFQDVHLTIPVFIKSDTYKFPDIHEATQIQVNHLMNTKEQDIKWSLQILPYNETFIEEARDQGEEYHIVTLMLEDFVGFNAAYDSKNTIVYFNDENVVNNDLPFFVAQTLVEHTFNVEWQYFSESRLMQSGNNNVAINYNPDVHLSINLLNGDGSPIDWEIDETLKIYFTPLREFLSPLVNFTVDTTVTYFNDLNLHNVNNTNTTTWKDISHIIDLSELSSMNHFTENSVVNLAVVFPSNTTTPEGLQFIDSEDNSNWKSFIVPRWGVLILNKYPLAPNTILTRDYLDAIMYKFSNDLFELLGLTSDMKDIFSPVITIDSFKRVRIMQNMEKSIETLWSLVKLTEQFEQMTIPEEVLENLKKVLEIRLQVVDILNDPLRGDDNSWNEALRLSNDMVKESETAFFHGEMLKQNFFPQEHKLAVYLPLMGPISIVLLTGIISLFKEPSGTTEKETEKELTKDEEEEKKESIEAASVDAIDGVDEIQSEASS